MKTLILLGMTLLAAASHAQTSGFGPPSFNCAVNDTYQDNDFLGVSWKCGPNANSWAPNPAFEPWGGAGTGLPLSGGTLTGPLIGTSIVACTTNGITNPTTCGTTGDIGAQVNAAAAALCPTNPVVYIPANFSAGEIRIPFGTYTYTTDIYLPCPVTLSGEGAQLTYNGTGNAVKVGPSTLTSTLRHDGLYRITGITWTGGASMAEGILFEPFVTNVVTDHLRFSNFGSATSWAIFYAGNNWEAKSTNDIFWTTDTTGRNFAKEVGANSRVTFDHLNAHGGVGPGNSTTNIGLDLDGPYGIVENSEVSVFGVNFLLDQFGSNVTIRNTLSECWNNNGCIGYGAASANFLTGDQIIGNVFNVHGTDGSLTGSVMFPQNANTGLSFLTFQGNQILNLPSVVAIVQNNNALQIGNVASGNTSNSAAIPTLHTTGSNIFQWLGTDGDVIQLRSVTGIACSSATAGTFNYIQGNSTTKDIVQVCAHDASNVYAFRSIY